MTAHSVENLFIEAMRTHALKKKALNWYCDNGSIVSGINLQLSSWNGRRRRGVHYVNAGCYIRELDLEGRYFGKIPPASNFHIRFRAGNLFPGEYIDVLPCLDDDLEVSETERQQAIKTLVDDHLVPIIRKLATRQGVIDAYRESLLPAYCFQGGYGRVAPWILARV